MDASTGTHLNEQQLAAVGAPLNRPLLIIAGAGTGKTNTLVHRVARLVADGVSPSRILLLTFTRRAAAEMLRRAELVLTGAAGLRRGDGTALRRVWGGTFHSIANRLLRAYAAAVGLPEAFTVVDRSDAEDLLNEVRSGLKLDSTGARFPRKATCLDIYSRCVNAGEALEETLRVHFPWCSGWVEQLRSLFRAYVARKQQQNVLDYDDLLLYWFHLMQDEKLAAALRQRFDAVLVDEYQDTNAIQAQILQRLCPGGRGLTVVGDDAQAIYSFRGATVRNILEFTSVYPDAIVVRLEHNYRSVQPILDATNAVIALAPRRHAKELFSARQSAQKPRLVTLVDEEQQSDYVIRRVLEHHEAGIPLRRQAVLFRAAHHSDALEVELMRRNIPFVKYGGLKFLEAAHVKDVLCILRLADNPRDTVSALRALQLMDGFGPAHARRAAAFLEAAGFDLRRWSDFRPPPAAAAQWPQFVALVAALSRCSAGGDEGGGPMSLADQIAAVRQFYVPILQKRYDQAHVRARDLEQLEQIACNFRSRSDMLAELALDPPGSTQDLAGTPLLDEDYLILSTIHSAKGCEWDVVYVIHAADGNIPSDMATGDAEQVEEERRLFYVALTRARDFLEVCFPLRYYYRRRSDRHSYAQLTRFLPAEILDRFERVSLHCETAPGDASPATASHDIRAKVASMWD